MRDDTETDFCDRLPGQHLGRLSLELQASEAAEWQRKINELECRLTLAEGEIRRLTTPATPSAAVGASEPVAGNTVPPEVGKRYVCRNGEVTDAMTDDGGPAYPFVTRVEGVLRSWKGDGRHDESKVSEHDLISEYHEPKPSRPAGHHVCFYCEPGGNQTPENPSRTDFCWRCGHRGEGIRRDDQKPSPPAESPDVSGEIRGLNYALEWIASKRAGNPKLKSAAWEMLNDMQVHFEAAVARLQDGESINSTSHVDTPAESPDDWVTQDRVPARPGIDRCWLSLHGNEPSDNMALWWDSDCDENAVGKMHGDASGNPGWRLNVRCRRKDLPVVPEDSNAEQATMDAVTIKPALPQFPEGAEKNTVLWLHAAAWTTLYDWCLENGMPRYSELNGLQNLAQWILDLKAAAKPNHPNAAPAEKPRMRKVTLNEYYRGDESHWTTFDSGVQLTGRTAVVEVPE